MALIKLNVSLNNLKKDLGGIANRLKNDLVNQVENKLENSVNDLFSKGLKSVGLSSSVANEISSRFGDAFSKGKADTFFGTSTSEQTRMTPQEICDGVLPRNAETAFDAANRITTDVQGIDGIIKYYPSHIGEYYMMMKFKSYERPAPHINPKFEFKEAIVLPLPSKLEEAFRIKASPESQGMTGGIFDALQAIGAPKESGQKFDSGGAATALAYSKMVQATEGLTEGLGNIMTQYAGSIPNPHLSVIFQGIDLRTHKFEWTFAPRNPQESAMLRDLLYKLKSNALPAYSKLGTAVLQYPLICQIELYPWTKDKNEFMLFKPTIITDVSINYAPNGIPSFFAGTKEPSFISLSLEFQEIELVTSETYGGQGAYEQRLPEIVDKLNDAVKNATGVDLKKSAGDLIDSTAEFVGFSGGSSATPGATTNSDAGTPTKSLRPSPAGSTSSSTTPKKQSSPQGQYTTNQALTLVNSMSPGSVQQIKTKAPDGSSKNYTLHRVASRTNVTGGTTNSFSVPENQYYLDIMTDGNVTKVGPYATKQAAYDALKQAGAVR